MAASIVGESSSSSSSSSKSSCTHHVFLSFRGDDTRKGFLSHLYAALDMKGITTFKDDRLLQIGDDISNELMRAIEESMFAIVLLSKNYANSTWCLSELQKIVECKDDKGLSIVPVFYDVDPSHVRRQKGSFEEAFKKHEERFGSDNEKIKKWRYALTQVAGCSGWESKNMDEATLVESIAEDIFKKLIPKLSSSTDKHVGILSKVEKVYSLLGLGLNDVRFIGIWGMGGIGKTTIARTVYETIQCDFKVSCFLSNVRERCDKNGIAQIQEDLVKCVNISARNFPNELDGRRVIQNSLCNKKVLLVIDDVNDAIQLENLAGSQNWFGPGSRIIITTRDLHLLEVHGVHGSYKVEGLNENEAMHLFCLKAFKQDQPKEGYLEPKERYLELSKEVVKYCDGLPLALEVLGSYLCGKPIDGWHSGIKKIKSVSHIKILDKLKISYDDLDLTQKDIFLDIACFFKGATKDYVVDILEKCGKNPQTEIYDLIDRSLITVNKKNELEMHDLLEEMGKNIVIQESFHDPGKRSRLWSKEDINLVLTKDKGTESIQAIYCAGKYDGGCTEEAFSRMSQLKLLNLPKSKFPHQIKYLPSSLKVFRLATSLLRALPLTHQHYEIVEIVLNSYKIEQLWHGKLVMESLKNLDLSNCSKLKQLPDVSSLPNLEKLTLSHCGSLTELPTSIIHHKNLLVLDLSRCYSLKTFPSGKLEMVSLRELILDGCTRLMSLPEFGECMKNLSKLFLWDLPIHQLPSSFGCLIGLEELVLWHCKNLFCIPNTIHELKSLRILRVKMCYYLTSLPSPILHLESLSILELSDCCLTEKEFPHDFCYFPSLTELDLSGNNFVSVPMSIHKLSKLRHLKLNKCRKLRLFPELPASIRELDAQGCDSIDTYEFNPLSKACNVFASSSSSQDHGEVVLQMVVPAEKKIPSLFSHQESGSNCVSIRHQKERLGIALCFLFKTFGNYHDTWKWLEVHHNGKRLITKIVDLMEPGLNLYILYLSNGYLNEKIQVDNKFEVSTSYPRNRLKILSSAAHWIHEQDVEDLKKLNKHNSKNKRKVEYLLENTEEMEEQ